MSDNVGFIIDEFYYGPSPEETIRGSEVSCCSERAKKVLAKTREIMDLEHQIIEAMKRSLESKDREISALKQEREQIELIKMERRPAICSAFRKILKDCMKDRQCSFCPSQNVSCAECLMFFDTFVTKIEREGYLQKMSRKLLETKQGNLEAKAIITSIMKFELNFEPIWGLE